MPREKAHGEHGKNLFSFVGFIRFVAIFISQNLAEKTRKLTIVITEMPLPRIPRIHTQMGAIRGNEYPSLRTAQIVKS
jgi:hypothetical protein